MLGYLILTDVYIVRHIWVVKLIAYLITHVDIVQFVVGKMIDAPDFDLIFRQVLNLIHYSESTH